MKFKRIIWLFLILNLYGNVVNLIRINSQVISFPYEEIMIVILQTFITLISVICFVQFLTLESPLKNISKKLFSFFSLILIVNIYSSITGIINGYSDKVIPDFITFINGPIIALSISALAINIKQLKIINKIIANYLLIIFLGSFIIVYFELALRLRIYPALNPTVFAFIIPYFYFNQLTKKWIFSFILLLLGLKRSVLLAFLITVFPFRLAMKKKVKLNNAILRSTVSSLITIVIMLYSFSLLEEQKGSFASTMVNKFSTVNPFSNKFDFKLGSGERVEEVTQSIKAVENLEFGLLLGAGNGFTYELNIDRKDYFEGEHHNVHFSPVLYITRYGIPVALLFYGFLFYMVSIGIKRFRNEKTLYPWIFYAIFGIFSSFFSFSFSSDILFWISIGVLMNNVLYKEYLNNKICVE